MKRILIFNDCLQMGGAEILLVDILNHISEKNCDITLLLPNASDKNILLNSIPSQVNIKYLYNKPLSRFRRILYTNILLFLPRLYTKLLKIKSIDYDIVVCFKDCIYSAAFSKMKSHKVIWIHNQPHVRKFEYKNWTQWFIMQLTKIQISQMERSFSKYNEIICVSESCKKDFIKIYNKGIPKNELRVLYNTLDLNKITKKSNSIINYSFQDSTTFILVTRLSAEKRVDRVIEAASKLQTEGYLFNILILGNGIEFENIKCLIESKNLSAIIKMLGSIENPYPYIKHSDWLVCTSIRESFSLVLLEAISLDTPIITTNCGGPADLIDNGEYGLLTENSTEGVYMGMKHALDNASLSDHYKSKKDECLRRFDHGKWLQSIDEIFHLE